MIEKNKHVSTVPSISISGIHRTACFYAAACNATKYNTLAGSHMIQTLLCLIPSRVGDASNQRI